MSQERWLKALTFECVQFRYLSILVKSCEIQVLSILELVLVQVQQNCKISSAGALAGVSNIRKYERLFAFSII